MTKREINESIRAVTGAMAWCRGFVQANDFERAITQARAAQLAAASVVVRCQDYAKEKAA